ncbi:uncharacterized protein LOC108905115 [Anoplophora glabripennis]|nr:uncharacterized protein LOC108905115 [Anoplophora glabripennis]
MENESSKLNFSLLYETHETSLQLLKTDTVGKLKVEIHKLYGISPEEQVIDGWRNVPNSDKEVLQDCAQLDDITNLVIKSIEDKLFHIKLAHNKQDEDVEVEAAVSFISKIMNKFDNSPIHFHACKLQDAINEACMVSLEKRKALCLYLHNENDKFSSVLCENIKKAEVVEILNRNFFFLGYDIEETKYQSALMSALHRCRDLSSLSPIVESKISAAVCVVPIQDSVTIFSCIRGRVSNKDFLVALSNAENFLVVENQQEKNLEELREKTASENDMGSTNYQKLMADMLGDRDWDRFEHDQHEYLKKKIAFALLGPPQKEEGYEKKDLKKVEALYGSILKSNHEITKYKGRVEISFMYNCTEPLPSEKMSRAKKYIEYNPNTDVMPLPIFVIRKCHGSADPCRVFIDNIGRTYQTWHEYIAKNKFHQCEMILPLNGRYEVNENGEVLLERHLSPACGVDSKLLHGADYLSTAGGLISGGIFIAAAIPTIAVAPAALIAGGVIGLGVGIYSMGRSAYTLYDRKKHKETLTFANSEARGAYLSILAGSLGFVGVGATVAVSQLASAGVNIGQGAGAAIHTLGYVNLGATGASMLNSGYDVIDHWVRENKAVSLLTIIQLKSSILFFGNVVHHKDSRYIDEKQARILQNYQESMRNNRARKPFLKLQKQTLQKQKGKDVDSKIMIISPIVKIPSKDDILAVLVAGDDSENKKRLTFIMNEDKIKLNEEEIDIMGVMNRTERDASVFLTSNCFTPDPSSNNTKYVYEMISKTLRNVSSDDIELFVDYLVRILSCFSGEIRFRILRTFIILVKNITNSVEQALDEIFSDRSKYFHLIDVVICFFGKTSEGLKDQWKTWLNTGKAPSTFLSFFEKIDEDGCNELLFFEKAVETSYHDLYSNVDAERNLLRYFYNWLTKQVYDNQERLERDWSKREKSSDYPTEKVSCTVCGGYFYRKSRKQ